MLQIVQVVFHGTAAICWGRWMKLEAKRKEVRSHCIDGAEEMDRREGRMGEGEVSCFAGELQ